MERVIGCHCRCPLPSSLHFEEWYLPRPGIAARGSCSIVVGLCCCWRCRNGVGRSRSVALRCRNHGGIAERRRPTPRRRCRAGRSAHARDGVARDSIRRRGGWGHPLVRAVLRALRVRDTRHPTGRGRRRRCPDALGDPLRAGHPARPAAPYGTSRVERRSPDRTRLGRAGTGRLQPGSARGSPLVRESPGGDLVDIGRRRAGGTPWPCIGRHAAAASC